MGGDGPNGGRDDLVNARTKTSTTTTTTTSPKSRCCSSPPELTPASPLNGTLTPEISDCASRSRRDRRRKSVHNNNSLHHNYKAVVTIGGKNWPAQFYPPTTHALGFFPRRLPTVHVRRGVNLLEWGLKLPQPRLQRTLADEGMSNPEQSGQMPLPSGNPEHRFPVSKVSSCQWLI